MSRTSDRSPDDRDLVDRPRVRAVLALGGVPWHALDDGLQQVRLKLLETRSRGGGESIRDQDAWVVVVASRVAVDWHRSTTRDQGLRDRVQNVWSTSPPAATPEEVATALDVASVLETLTPTQRQVLLLRYFEDLSVADIADRLDVPLGTVKSRLHSAESAFRTRLEAEEEPS
jgi:RNA polymerase sigma-70 factor (ECF subfamily)